MQVAQPLMRPPGLNLPRRERRVSRFSMTALADVLFQLLIFFMLSSNPSAYAMLPLRSGALQGEGGAEPAGAGTNVTGTETTAVWTLNIDGITASGQRFAISRLPALARALVAQQTQHVLIVLRPDVPVQDVVTVLEVLSAHGIGSVQIAEAATPTPASYPAPVTPPVTPPVTLAPGSTTTANGADAGTGASRVLIPSPAPLGTGASR